MVTTYNNQSRNSSSFTGISKTSSTDAFQLLIDGTYFFLIDATYKLNIQNQSGQWTNVTKN